MFRHLLRYTLTSTLRDKDALFWVICFPILLLSIMGFSFSGLRNPQLEKTAIGLAPDCPEAFIYRQVDILDIHEIADPESARRALQEKSIRVYIDADGELYASESNYDVSLVRSICQSVRQAQALGPAARHLRFDQPLSQQKDSSSDPLSISLLAMVAMFSFYSYFNTSSFCAAISGDQSTLGARQEVAPVRKFCLLSVGLVASLLYGAISLSCLLLVSEKLFGFDLIHNYAASIPLLASGVLCSSAIGYLIGSIPKLSPGTRTGLGIGVTMSLSFLSGMNSPDILVLIQKTAPLLARLNPISRLTVTLYQVNGLGNSSQVLPTCLLLLGISLICILLAAFRLGKPQHAWLV